MIQRMDYGYFRNNIIEPTPVKKNKNTQVFLATHDREGNRLPYMNRSFISFSYGGKLIEDFGFIAVTENNQIQRKIYADFNDVVTESDVYNGQIYWSSHYNANELELALFTDGVTERQMDDFKHWFIPGKQRELILSQHPNRGILARISEAPTYYMLPFEQKTTVMIAGQSYDTSTTLYKGKIKISFVMDDPFWYSLSNILDKKENNDENYNAGQWVGANGELVFILDDKDAIKVIHEDGIPYSEMTFDINSLLEENSEQEQIFLQDGKDIVLLGTNDVVSVDLSNSSQASRVGEAINDDDDNDGARVSYGHVAYLLKVRGIGLNFPENEEQSFYYAGTAPCGPIITFKMKPKITENSTYSGYIVSPKNNIANVTGNNFNTFIITGGTIKEFKITTPSIWTGYNQAIWIFKNTQSDTDWEEVRQAIRDNVKHYAPRIFAIRLIDSIAGDSLNTTSEKINELIEKMPRFLKDENGDIYSATFTFNCKTGESVGEFQYSKIVGIKNEENQSEEETTEQTQQNQIQSDNQEEKEVFQTENLEEDIGEMVKSKYLVIEDRDEPTEDGYIIREKSHKISHDIQGGIYDFNLEYKYMYL